MVRQANAHVSLEEMISVTNFYKDKLVSLKSSMGQLSERDVIRFSWRFPSYYIFTIIIFFLEKTFICCLLLGLVPRKFRTLHGLEMSFFQRFKIKGRGALSESTTLVYNNIL